LTTVLFAKKLTDMARYSAYLGRKVEVHYRAGDVCLPASGTFVADSGRSIFLEQRFQQRGLERTFRWEVPYAYIIRIEELPSEPAPARPPFLDMAAPEKASTTSGEDAGSKTKAAAAGGASSIISFAYRAKLA
jgi:hypothetical protein